MPHPSQNNLGEKYCHFLGEKFSPPPPPSPWIIPCHYPIYHSPNSLFLITNLFQDAPVRNGSGQLCHPKLEPVSNPVMGETYLSHFPAPVTSDLKVSGEVPCHQWFRVRTVAITSSHVKVLAIDFGFSTELPMEALFALTKQCRGIPPQVNR